MKLEILVCTFALLLLSVAATPEPKQPLCTKEYEDGMCSRESNPVCGTDGITYSNVCILCWKNKVRSTNVLIRHAGECEAI